MANYLHPDYRYFKPDWDLIRDVMAGERRIKEMGKTYLPPLSDTAGTSYDEYRERAVFVNMLARTVNGLVGTLYRRQPKVLGLKDALLRGSAQITPDGASVVSFGKTVATELTPIGRVGILVDMDPNGVNPPYMTYYIAENILSWKTEFVDGRERLVYVLLREVIDDFNYFGVAGSTAPAPVDAPRKVGSRQTRIARTPVDSGATPSLRAQFRVLSLENGAYVQRIYKTTIDRGVEVIGDEPVVIRPTRRGNPLDFIPFTIVGTAGVSAKVTKPPMLDIANLNVSHYKSSAQLEHGRFFTALPVYYAPARAGEEGGEYTVGPSMVWEVMPGEKPGILEYYGTGLRELANSLAEKEQHISQLGGRIMGITKDQGSQSPEVAALTHANEVSVLTTIGDALSEGMTAALRQWAWWQDMDAAELLKVEFRMNRDYATSNIGAREMRAIAVLYQSGVLPVEEMHRVFQESELISEQTSVEDFVSMLKSAKSFPNQPNIEAMQEGFADAKDRTQFQIAELAAKTQKDVSKQTLDANGAQAVADRQHEKNLADRQHAQQLAVSEQGQKQTMEVAAKQAPNGNRNGKSKPS